MGYLRFKLPHAVFKDLETMYINENGLYKYEKVGNSRDRFFKEIAPEMRNFYLENKKHVLRKGARVRFSTDNLQRAFFKYGKDNYDGAVLPLADWICRYLTDDLKMTFLQYQGLSSQTELAQYLAPFYEKVVIGEDEDVYEKQYPEKKKKVEVVVEKTTDLPKFITSIHSPPKKFVGREIEIAALQKRLENESLPLLVSGMGGMGKTSIVAKWFVEHLEEYNHIIWIDCLTGLSQAFVNSLETKELPNDWKLKEKESPDTYTKRILHKILNVKGKNLLIIDGLDDETEINQYRQELNIPNWTVLITTRVQLSDLPCFFVGKLDESTASRLFEEHAQQAKNDPFLPQLLEYIDYHTLTIELLAKTFENTFYIESIEQLLELLQENKWEDEDLIVDIKINHSDEYVQIYSHLLSTFHLSELSEYEKWLLLQFSVLPSIPINGKELGEWIQVDKKEREMYLNSLNSLAKKGWIDRVFANWFQVHLIVQTVVLYQLQLNANKCRELIQSLETVLNIEVGDNSLHKTNYIVYAEILLKRITNEDIFISNLANNLSFIYFQHLSDFPKALFYQQLAIKIREQILEKDHPDLAFSYSRLSLIYQSIGKLKLAATYQQKAIRIGEVIFGLQSVDLSTFYNHFAMISLDLGNFTDALIYQVKAINIREAVPNIDLVYIAEVYHNISVIYQECGGLDKSLQYKEKALEIAEQLFEPLHPDLATVYHGISIIHRKLRNFEDALKYQYKTLNIRKKIFKPLHILMSITYLNIGHIYIELSNFENALSYIQQSIKIQEANYEKDSIHLSHPYNTLSVLYKRMKNFNMALKYELKAIHIREKLLNPLHSDLAFSYINIAEIYYELNNAIKSNFYINRGVFIFNYNFLSNHPRLQEVLNIQEKINENYIETYRDN